MAFYQNTPTDLAISTALQTWIMEVLSLDLAHVVQGYDNRVSQPMGDYVLITRMGSKPLSTPWLTYNDTGVQATESEMTNISIEVTYQLDVYGPNSCDHAITLFALLRSDATSEWFANYGGVNGITLDTFYTDDPQRSVLTNQEGQYEDRWILRTRLDIVQQVATSVNFMSVLSNPAIVLKNIQ
jgi:hypothetical protein